MARKRVARRRRAPKPKRKLSAYNRHVASEMKKGKSMKQAASSWRGRGKSKKRRTIRRPSRKVGRKVGRNGFNQQKLFKLARMAALLGPHAGVWLSGADPMTKASESVKMLSGFDMSTGQFDMQSLVRGYGPLLATTAVTALVPKINGLLKGLL